MGVTATIGRSENLSHVVTPRPLVHEMKYRSSGRGRAETRAETVAVAPTLVTLLNAAG